MSAVNAYNSLYNTLANVLVTHAVSALSEVENVASAALFESRCHMFRSCFRV